MKKIYRDSVLFRKLLYTEHFVHQDSFEENRQPLPEPYKGEEVAE